MFLGVAILISRKMANNDKTFFEKFSSVRSKLEKILIEKKDLIATVLQKTISGKRVNRYADLLDTLVSQLHANPAVTITDEEIVTLAGLTGKIITGAASEAGAKFSEDTKSAVFIKSALQLAMRCPVCDGYLDPEKSISYDHITEKAVGGKGDEKNCQLTHPYCNQAVKNKIFQAGSE
jgi:hypothetical protein